MARRARRIGKWVGLSLLVLVAVKVGWFASVRGEGTPELRARLGYLVERLLSGRADGAAPESPLFAGEWKLVTLSMTAAASANLSFATGRADPATLARLIERTLARDVRAFDEGRWGEDALDSLEGPNGHVGMLGHLGLMLGAHRLGGGDGRWDELYHRIVSAIERRAAASPTPFLETYPGETYTADNAVLMAAVALHDRAFGTDHRAMLDRWVREARAGLLDERSGIMVSGVDAAGRPRGSGRGSFAGWSSFYLPFVDDAFARQQWTAIRGTLVVRLPPGLAAIREVPRGESATGDVDSGPVLFGLSPSGTGFAIGGARRAGDHRLAEDLLDTAEVVGGTLPWGGRRYALAPLVGDAILLAMRTARPWDGRFLRSP